MGIVDISKEVDEVAMTNLPEMGKIVV